MPDLQFTIDGAEPVPHAAAPSLALKLKITNKDRDEHIRGAIVQCQIQIEAVRRPYAAVEQKQLLELFGTPDRWSQTLRAMLWTHAHVNVGSFNGQTRVDLPVPCTFDFNVAATKYFSSLESGDVPLCLLFSGSVFYEDRDRGVQVSQIPWSTEARFRMPVSVWKGVIDLYYPNTAWLALRRDVFDRLRTYKTLRGLPTWEQALEGLLSEAEEKTLT